MALVVLASGLMLSLGVSAEELVAEGADLVVSDMMIFDMFGAAQSTELEVTSGQPFMLVAAVENIGTLDSGAFCTAMYIDGVQVASFAAERGLATGAGMNVTFEGLIVSEPGSHEIVVVADSEDSIDEFNRGVPAEGNNEMAEVLVVIRAEWTFAVYLDGDNNLEYYGILDFLEMASVGTTSSVNIVVQFDRIDDSFATEYGNWTDAKRFLVTQGMEPVAESAFEELGEVNMGDWTVLADFAGDTFARFRSIHTCLVLWDHGHSWYGGCCVDQTPSYDSLTTDEMRCALDVVVDGIGAKVDVIAFDACLMSGVEVCYAFEGLCDDFVASIQGIPGTGLPYDDILGPLTEYPLMSPDGLSVLIVDAYVAEYSPLSSFVTMSAFKVDAVCSDVKAALSVFADSLLAGLDRYERQITAARKSVDGFDLLSMQSGASVSADLYCFAEQVASRIKNDQIRSAAYDLMAALEGSRLAFGLYTSYRLYEVLFGITIFWPAIDMFIEEYESERLSLDTTWDEFLEAYYSE